MYSEISLPLDCIKAFEQDNIDVFYYKEIGSTNKKARELTCDNGRMSLIIAEGQTQGRGRLGRSFYSPAHSGLYMTLLFRAPEGDIFGRITALAAVCTQGAIKEGLGVEPQIKWVNDLYLEGKKICGILAECFTSGEERYVALGIGVNMFTEDFPEELENIAGSLGMTAEDAEESRALRLALAYRICKELKKALGAEDISKYMDIYRSASCVIGREITYTENGRTYNAKALDISNEGELIVLAEGAEKRLHGGEISVRAKKSADAEDSEK